jgi:hypothetical protein
MLCFTFVVIYHFIINDDVHTQTEGRELTAQPIEQPLPMTPIHIHSPGKLHTTRN